MTVGDILNYLEELAPRYMKMEWDNVGLLCGRYDQEVKTVLVALDPFESVCQEAAEVGADLLVTHHPLIFSAPKSITNDTSIGRSILFLAQKGISAINAHTNLDCAPGGVNDCLAAKLGLQNVEVIEPSGVTEDGTPWGLIRGGETEEQSLDSFLTFVKEALDCGGLRYVEGTRPVRRVAVGGGSCGDGVRAVADAGYDTFVTADVKYNQFRDAYDLGVNLIDAGHFCTENPVCTYLAEKLRERFPEIQVILSPNHRDCVKFR